MLIKDLHIKCRALLAYKGVVGIMSIVLATIIVVVFVGFMLFNNRNMKTYNQCMKRMKKLKKSINFINPTQEYVNQNMAIAINQDEKKLCVSTMKNGSPHPLTYTFNDILDCEIVEYKVTEQDANINGRQNLGRILSDSVDKVVENLIWKKEERVNRIDLKVSFKDSENPYVLLNFLYWEVTKDSEEYKKTYEAVNYWHRTIHNIIKAGHA